MFMYETFSERDVNGTQKRHLVAKPDLEVGRGGQCPPKSVNFILTFESATSITLFIRPVKIKAKTNFPSYNCERYLI